MRVLGVQYYDHNGPDTIGTHKIRFTVDESQRDTVSDLVKYYKRGSSLLLLIIDVEKESEEVNQIATETPDKTKKRFSKRMHAMINDIARRKKISSEIVKDTLKKYLISRKLMKQSSTELSLEGLTIAIQFLQNEFKEEEHQEGFSEDTI